MGHFHLILRHDPSGIMLMTPEKNDNAENPVYNMN